MAAKISIRWKLFGVVTIVSLQLSRVLQAACPSGESVKIYGHSGVIRAKEGYNQNDECAWKVYAPREKRDHRIVVNITRISCSKNLIIEGEDFCQHKPRITRTYIPSSCKQDCKRSNCRKIAKYPLTIKYGRYANDHGFLIRYAYVPCASGPKSTTTAAVQSTTAAVQATTSLLTEIQTTKSSNSSTATTMAFNYTDTSTNNIPTTTAAASNSSRVSSTTASQTSISPESQVSLAVIIAPIVAAVLVILLLAVIAIKIWRIKHKADELKKQEEANDTIQSYIPTVNVIDIPIYETLNKRNPAQTYENQAYQTLPREGVGGSYAENNYGTVFQSTSEDQDEEDVEVEPTEKHIYEQVNSDVEVIENVAIVHEYDSVASESGEEHSFEEDSSASEDL